MAIKLFKRNSIWVNRHMTVNQTVGRLYEIDIVSPDLETGNEATAQEFARKSIETLQEILASAEQEGACVRAIGSGWSLSKILETNDFLVVTKPFNLIVPKLPETYIQPALNHECMVFSQCGASVKELNQVLERYGKALPTTGASDGQTIVGAISTGTHGSAIHVGSMPDYVEGIHIITKCNDHIWLEGDTKVVTQTFIDNLAPGARRVNDEQCFKAALVSFGSFGIIHGLLLSCEKVFKLQQFQRKVDWKIAQRCINGPGNFQELGLPANPYFFKVVINPYNMKKVNVMVMYKEYGLFEQPAPPEIQRKHGFGIDLLHILGTLDTLLGRHSDELMKIKALDKFYQKQFPELKGVWGSPRFIFGGSESQKNEPGMSIELGFNALETSRALDKILDVAKRFPFMGLIALRYVKRSKATFSLAKFETTCAVEILCLKSDNTQRFYKNLWEELDQDGFDFTFHMGQMNNLDDLNIRRRWETNSVTHWTDARRLILPEVAQQRRFSNKFLEKLGLHA